MVRLLSHFCGLRAYGVQEMPLNHVRLGCSMFILSFSRTVNMPFNSAIDSVVHNNVSPNICIDVQCTLIILLISVYINILYIQIMFGTFLPIFSIV